MADQELSKLPHQEIKQEMENGSVNGAQQEERGTVIWNYVLTNRLIELWQEKPYLYDVNSLYYKDKHMKAKALEEIANKMGVTVEDVKAKIKGVRSQFVREKKRLRDCADEDPRPRWPHYSKLLFLENFIVAKPPTSTSKRDHSEEDKDWMDYEDLPHDYFGNKEYQTQPEPVVHADEFPEPPVHQPAPPAPPVSPYSISPRLAKRFKKKTDEDAIVRRYLSLIDKVDKVNGNKQEVQTKTDDDDEIFGKYIATELRTIPDPHVKRSVKLQIHQAIFKAHSSLQLPNIPHVVMHSSLPTQRKRRKNYSAVNHDDGRHEPIYFPMNDDDPASTSTSVPSLSADRGSPSVLASVRNGEVE
ncbi:uncharacterized protein LOC117122848 [Anneissia japonica]|uniref:uncharacterized protein LOC117122848 n=1 Tax=Anneissia japonica TaxID=1529436 RepID=UPI0014259D09|nr:uncharacterized protein LOC117122848 [Anneissia japonica]